jgi:hypothetical protein
MEINYVIIQTILMEIDLIKNVKFMLLSFLLSINFNKIIGSMLTY